MMSAVTSRIAGLKGSATRLLPGVVRKPAVWGGLGALIAVILVFYYPIGMALTHQINDDVNYQVPKTVLVKDGSRSVAMAAALIEREVVLSRWVSNDPFFLAPAALDNMPNFQQGIISALARFAFELTDQIGRTRGTSQTDPDLQKAAGQLQYEGDVWVFDLSTSLAPTVTSEARYKAAGRALQDYNARVATGAAVFERRADNLLATLDRFALDLGASSAALDNHIAENSSGLIDWKADDVF